MVLVVGATGQLGSSIVRELVRQGRPVRAFVRPTSSYRALEAAGVELAFGDVRDVPSIEAALAGVDIVIATATAISPGKGGGDVHAVDGRGIEALIDACRASGTRHFLFPSVPPGRFDERVSILRYKRLNERRLEESGVPYTIFRLGMFAEVWASLLGSSIPERGVEASSLQRPFWFLRSFRKKTGRMIEEKGKAMIPGRGDIRVSFICVDEVARMMVNAAGREDAMNRVFEVGGPEVLTFDEAVDHFARLLGRPIRSSYTPASVFRLMHLLLKPLSPSAGAVMGLNWVTAAGGLVPPDPEASRAIAGRFGVTLTSFEDFLRRKVIDSDRIPAES